MFMTYRVITSVALDSDQVIVDLATPRCISSVPIPALDYLSSDNQISSSTFIHSICHWLGPRRLFTTRSTSMDLFPQRKITSIAFADLFHKPSFPLEPPLNFDVAHLLIGWEISRLTETLESLTCATWRGDGLCSSQWVQSQSIQVLPLADFLIYICLYRLLSTSTCAQMLICQNGPSGKHLQTFSNMNIFVLPRLTFCLLTTTHNPDLTSYPIITWIVQSTLFHLTLQFCLLWQTNLDVGHPVLRVRTNWCIHSYYQTKCYTIIQVPWSLHVRGHRQ